MIPLPIDPLLPEVAASLQRSPNLVLTAEPGAGKTTRVPPSLLAAFGPQASVLVVEPRRLAARLSAVRVAEEGGSRLGDAVGYQVRFDERSSAATRLLYVTEGILLRRLLSDPSLTGTGYARGAGPGTTGSAGLGSAGGAGSGTTGSAGLGSAGGAGSGFSSVGGAGSGTTGGAGPGTTGGAGLGSAGGAGSGTTGGAGPGTTGGAGLGSAGGAGSGTTGGAGSGTTGGAGPRAGGRSPVIRAVILDEFHERSLQSDLLLAFLRQLQQRRTDLSIVVMSATLDAEPAAAFLGGAPSMHAPGRLFPVDIAFAPHFDPAPLEDQVASAVRRALREDEGDVLVFLPGMAEIRRCAGRIGTVEGVAVLPLHGTLPPEEQDRAVRPSSRRKVILSTNVAETSLTIDGVTVVIDSGLARIAGHSSWSGLPTLKMSKVSRASAAQRAGRAGRTRPGRVYRLYTRADHDARPAHEVPEIRRADLCEPVLLLRALGVRDPLDFPWFEAPAREAIQAADELLHRLGAVAGNALTPVGARLASFPLHPRLGRVLLEAERRGVGPAGAELVALLQERDTVQPSGNESGDSDPLWALERFAEEGRGGPVRRSAAQLGRLLHPPPRNAGERVDRSSSRSPPHSSLLISLLTGYPDRVAKRRRPGSDELLLSGGGTARLSRQSVVKEPTLLVAIEAEEQRRAGESAIGLIRSASAIEPEWLLDLYPERMRDEQRVRFLPDAERVDVDSLLMYDELVLEESRGAPAGSEAVAAALAEAALARGPSAYVPAGAAGTEGEPARTLARLAFAREHMPELGLPALGADDVAGAVRTLAAGKRRFDELREGGLLELLLGGLDPTQRQAFEAAAPESLALPSGRRARIEYEQGKPPWVESRMQDFCGWADGPRLARGRVPLTLHLTAPNHRAVQVTSDLAGFWERHYPAIRRELMRRYPRHPWPENPRLPLPPRPPRRP